MKQALLLMFAVLLSVAAYGQRKISGTVSDQNGEALIGASVLVKGTAIGTATDIDGGFELTIPADQASNTLVVSYTGFETRRLL